jgi:hypothetical protein
LIQDIPDNQAEGSASLHWTSDTLPTAIQDVTEGLAGRESEWQDSADTLFKCSALPSLNRDIKRFRGQRAGSEIGDSMTENSAETRRTGVLARARAIRRDLRAFIDQTGVDESQEYSGGVSTTRRRRGVSAEDDGEEGMSEREFRRRRTAEILESTNGRGDVEEVDVAIPLRLPFYIAREPVGR